DGNERDAIVFELRTLEGIAERIDTETSSVDVPLDELRVLALSAANGSKANRNVYQRSRDVRNYVLARAKANCEVCKAPAPFLRAEGSPYLEPHHLGD